MKRLALILLLCACAAPRPPAPADPAPPANERASDLLASVGLRATEGAAAGYVEDAGCALCHGAIYDSYQDVGMARSMSRPRRDDRLERFGEVFSHERSGNHYQMAWSGDALLFRRWRLDDDGERTHEIEIPVDWIVGSGYRSRIYLYRNPAGELYQLPLAWYAQDRRWGMAPGFDRPDHAGIERRVRRECLFCHNGYPEVPAGSDAAWAPHTFPASLPEGTGCQRCHGPGAGHVRAALDGSAAAAVRAAIVNPARLPRERRDSVCFQCHMLPAVEMIGVRRFGRDDYSFRPGELLADYMLHVDIDTPGRAREDRFEINHHAYRLQQSPCYRRGEITCIDCHDPHQPLASDPRLAAVAEVCQRCHEAHPIEPQDAMAGVAADDCASCHMPRRRTEDVVLVTMTDHRIQVPPDADLLAPLEEREPEIIGLTFLDPESAPEGTEGEIYRAVTALRGSARLAEPRAWLEGALAGGAMPSVVPLLDLIAAELSQQRFAEAVHFLGLLPDSERASPPADGWLGIAKIGLGQADEGLAHLRAAADASPLLPEAQFNLGVVLHQTGDHDEAVERLSRAIDLRPTFAAALYHRAEAYEALGREEDAIADLRRALEIRPSHARAQESLSRLAPGIR